MLVLSRKAGQRVVIGSAIEVVVLSARKGNVKLGFTAPHDMKIVRRELTHTAATGASCDDRPMEVRHVQSA